MPSSSLEATLNGMPQVELHGFRPEHDLALVSTWVGRPHVTRWWGEPDDALAKLRTHDAETVALISLDGRPVGLLCWQKPTSLELSQAGLSDLPSDLIDVDIMIGEPDAQGRGAGPEALRLLFGRLRAQGVAFAGVATELANRRAMSAYAKVGLVPFRDFVEVGTNFRYFTKCLTDAESPVHRKDAEGVSMARGECNCGAVQFEIDADLTDVFVCHCSICRKSTGSNGIAVVVVPNDQLRWVKGQEHIATWKKPNCDWQTWFCRICGSPVPGANDSKRMFAPAGSIVAGGDALRVAHHIWVGSKAPWDEIGDEGKQQPEGFRG